MLCQEFGSSFANCIDSAQYSAAGLVNLLTESFDCFRDETVFNGKRVRLYKRAQILVADLWACFNGEDFGEFHDIDKITMFAGEIQLALTILLHLLTVGYRLPHSADAPSTRMLALLSPSGEPHPQPGAVDTRFKLGSRATRNEYLVCRDDQA